jgi:hypothetical protein
VAIAGLATGPAMANDDGGGLLGSWMCVRQDDGSPDEIRLVLSFALGGVFVSHDISPAGPPFTGSWSGRGKSFRATFWTGFPGEQGPESVGPTVRVRLSGTVTKGHLAGTYRVTVFAPGSDSEVLESGTGKVTGRRINA